MSSTLTKNVLVILRDTAAPPPQKLVATLPPSPSLWLSPLLRALLGISEQRAAPPLIATVALPLLDLGCFGLGHLGASPAVPSEDKAGAEVQASQEGGFNDPIVSLPDPSATLASCGLAPPFPQARGGGRGQSPQTNRIHCYFSFPAAVMRVKGRPPLPLQVLHHSGCPQPCTHSPQPCTHTSSCGCGFIP